MSWGSSEPLQDAVSLTASTKWAGKLDRISQKFTLKLGKRHFVDRYKNIDMRFLGKATKDPIEMLQAMADMRHRIVHSAGRVDSKLIEEYPKSGLKEGEFIQIPFGFPFDIHFFFVPITDLLDEVFCTKFNWSRIMIAPERLIDDDLRM